MKNDNLNILFTIGNYQITILKFTYECQTWNTPSHAHGSNSYEIHFIPKGKGTLIRNQCSYELYPDILYTTLEQKRAWHNALHYASIFFCIHA